MGGLGVYFVLGFFLFGFLGFFCSIRTRNKYLRSHEPVAALQHGEFSWEQAEKEPDQDTVLSHQKFQKNTG